MGTYVARSSERLAMRWLTEIVSSSDVAIYELRMAGWIWLGAKRCLAIGKELRKYGAQIWLVTSKSGWMGVVGSSDKAGYELRMTICTYKVPVR
jgi:hypothetical protein